MHIHKIYLFVSLLLVCSLAHADRTMDECMRIAECTSQCSSSEDTTCLESCGAPIEMQQAIAALETCEAEACPSGDVTNCDTSECDVERMSVLFVCLGVDAGCIAASQCVDTGCEEGDVECASACFDEHLEGEALEAGQNYLSCIDQYCSDASDEEAWETCVDTSCGADDQAFMEACNFDALDGSPDLGDDEGNALVCDAFERCVVSCEDPNDWECLIACTDDLPPQQGADAIFDFLLCGQNAGCEGPGDEVCLEANCLAEAIALGDTCGGDEDGDDEDDGGSFSEECSEFINCAESCSDWECVDSCKVTYLDDVDTIDAVDDLSACGQASNCSPGDDDCLDANCRSEFSTLMSTCIDESGSDDSEDQELAQECEDFIDCLEICSTWECVQSCQTTTITDDTIDASLDELIACGSNACDIGDDDCLDTACQNEYASFFNACAGNSNGGTATGGESTGTDGSESGGSGSDDDGGCQSTQPSSVLALLVLFGALFYQRRQRLQPVRIRRQERLQRPIR